MCILCGTRSFDRITFFRNWKKSFEIRSYEFCSFLSFFRMPFFRKKRHFRKIFEQKKTTYNCTKTVFSKQVSSKKTIYFVRTAFERKKSVVLEEVLIFRLTFFSKVRKKTNSKEKFMSIHKEIFFSNMYDLSKIKWEFLLPSFERTVIEE